jgi:hypothetical protein
VRFVLEANCRGKMKFLARCSLLHIFNIRTTVVPIKEHCVLAYDAVYSGRNLPTYLLNVDKLI